jgi:gamma-glutamylputrescine oxidase
MRADAARWGAPPWRIDVELALPALPERVDVAVVGGGFTGLATALACAERGAAVHLFETGALGAGASGRTGGLVLEGTAAGPLPGTEACLDALSALVRSHAIDCDLDLRGCWIVRHDRAEPPAAPSWPDGDAGRLVVERHDVGGTVDPGKLVAGLARAALRAGAVLHERSHVERVAPARIRVDGRDVPVGRVVIATNAFLPRLVPRAKLRPALTLAIATAPLAPAALETISLGTTAFYTGDFPYLWGRATREGRLVIGAGLAFDDDGHVERVTIEDDEVRAILSRLQARTRGLHDALAGVAVTHAWGGPIAFREGAVPILAEVAPGVLATGAYAGHGVALSAAIARMACAWALDGAAPPAWGALEPA